MMPTHSEAMRSKVHGPIQPMDQSTLSQWRDLIDSRPADEPHPAFGAIILCGLLGILIATGLAFAIMTGTSQ